MIWAVVGAGLILGIAKRLGGTVTRKRGQEPTETLLQEHGMHLERRERGQRGKSPDNLGASDPVSRTRGSSLPKRI